MVGLPCHLVEDRLVFLTFHLEVDRLDGYFGLELPVFAEVVGSFDLVVLCSFAVAATASVASVEVVSAAFAGSSTVVAFCFVACCCP